MTRIAILILLLMPPATVVAKEVYQTPQAFIQEVFDDMPPRPSLLWLTKEVQEQAREILGHRLSGLRVRYWQQDDRSIWILDEVGKEQPITTGIVVKSGKIERLKVLVYRESRGWEVRYPFFTKQFIGQAIDEQTRLRQPIDGISGATLSVRALKKMARLALYFDRLTRVADDTP